MKSSILVVPNSRARRNARIDATKPIDDEDYHQLEGSDYDQMEGSDYDQLEGSGVVF